MDNFLEAPSMFICDSNVYVGLPQAARASSGSSAKLFSQFIENNFAFEIARGFQSLSTQSLGKKLSRYP